MISLEKMIDFDTFTKIAEECRRIGQIYCCPKALKSCPKSNKSPNLVTLFITSKRLRRQNVTAVEAVWADDVN